MKILSAVCNWGAVCQRVLKLARKRFLLLAGIRSFSMPLFSAKYSSAIRFGLAPLLAASVIILGPSGCSGGANTNAVPYAASTNPLAVYQLQGAVSLVHDPTIIRQGSEYYVLSTDGGQTGNLPIFCSTDKINWARCGQVFNTPPPEVLAVLPSLTELWAPDVSYFNGLYHVYYAASGFGANKSLIGLATSPTMNPSDPNYKWTDQGIVLSSTTSSSFNAIDPNIFIDTDSNGNLTHVWLTYGSFFNGINQQEISPTTGMILNPSTPAMILATRPGVTSNPIEGASLVKHDGYYYLFASFNFCCNSVFTTDNYEIVVGRGTSPNGPFTDQSGVSMMNGGGTVLLASSGEFTAPGGEMVYTDSTNGDLITFHALANNQNGLDYLFVNSLTWPGDWPLIGTQP
jgi:arabinan endo-1,5-alpha-L-arabinosidase